MTGSFGSLHGVKIPEKLTDDMPLEELPILKCFIGSYLAKDRITT